MACLVAQRSYAGDVMSLQEEVQAARKKVVTDGYEMSLGEVGQSLPGQ
jgi:hypothetical protein